MKNNLKSRVEALSKIMYQVQTYYMENLKQFKGSDVSRREVIQSINEIWEKIGDLQTSVKKLEK